MKERLDPYRGEVKVQPHEMRGSFEECRFQARILDRQHIDGDPLRTTGMVTFDLHNTGITFQPVSPPWFNCIALPGLVVCSAFQYELEIHGRFR